MTEPQYPDPAGRPADQEVPDCGTGPFGRLRFVARELAALWRSHRTTGKD